MLLPALSPVGTGALGEKVMNDGESLTCGALLGLFLPPELGGLITPLGCTGGLTSPLSGAGGLMSPLVDTGGLIFSLGLSIPSY